LLRGSEDADIQNWFITTAFPTADECRQVLDALERHDGFVKRSELEAAVNVRPTRIENLMKNLEVDGIVVADGQKYQRTPRPFSYDTDRIEAITALRHEQDEMVRYGTLTAGCRMVFLRQALDDPDPSPSPRRHRAPPQVAGPEEHPGNATARGGTCALPLGRRWLERAREARQARGSSLR
jgi:ATP-dependent DNA helicase RecQ